MSDQISNTLEKILSEIEIIKKQQKQLLPIQSSSLRQPRGQVFNQYGLPSGTARYMAPSADGLNLEEAIKQYLFSLNQKGERIPSGLKKMINPYQLEAGDLILVRPKDPDQLGVFGRIKWSQTIETQRKLIADEEHASFTHVAISRDYHQIYESVPENGVFFTSYWKYMTDNYDIKVRRLKGHNARNRSQISHNIAELFGKEYGFVDLVMIKALANEWEWLQNIASWVGSDNTYICSALFAASCDREGVDLDILGGLKSTSVVTPAHLSASTALEDVAIQWVTVS